VVADLEVVEMTPHPTTPPRPPAGVPVAPSVTRGARGFAYLGVLTGLVVSVAANIAHSFLTPPGWPAGRGWVPEPGAVLGAMFWPVALLLTTEILTRKRWPTGWLWLAVRLAGLLPVAGVAAVISYQHLHGLLQHYHESDLAAVIGPLSIDGLMVTASAALIAPDRFDTPTAHFGDAPTDATATTAATTPGASVDASAVSSGAAPRDETHSSSPNSSHESSTPSSVPSSRRASGASPRRSSSRSSGGSTAPSLSPSSGGSSSSSSGAGRRADDETLRALVATARVERPGAGEPAVRRLLVEAGLSASAARVRAALADPDGLTTASPAPVSGPQTGPDHITSDVADTAEDVAAAGKGPDEEAAA
jgi:hypothetical protein